MIFSHKKYSRVLATEATFKPCIIIKDIKQSPFLFGTPSRPFTIGRVGSPGDRFGHRRSRSADNAQQPVIRIAGKMIPTHREASLETGAHTGWGNKVTGRDSRASRETVSWLQLTSDVICDARQCTGLPEQ